ncbi:glycosyltransferase family 2 protein [Coraliomargarita akajimensis]|uniref:Glycosyl transferase family 2 n=1 Tax=Coraliomargarita akajimensis (strain DSM 45221 / IAM 15411 / JCM 23193 / KCTC 12865 / 04OKA010-24) TaxID=583355 RepID=D5EJZ4_CORAD|nr:glycosyltransferase family 2 protein [Coraliomargarita akajimensis]ADE54743.1 glycosyl transferase family 2 [Coraliomargarita akajimensis DSM 45221]
MSDYSIIIPFYNESETVVTVLREVLETNPGAEVVAVNDGSSDNTYELMQSVEGVTAYTFPENRGQSAAMYAGMRLATQPICVMMDGDGQNDPADIPKLRAELKGDIGMVCGYRAQRKDTASRRWASKIANKIRVAIIDDGLRDTGCSLKCFHREAVDHLVPFNGMHRYMAAMMKKAGLKISEIPVNHRERHAGTSKYTNWDRALRGIYDLFGVSWLLKRKVLFNVTVDRTNDPAS